MTLVQARSLNKSGCDGIAASATRVWVSGVPANAVSEYDAATGARVGVISGPADKLAFPGTLTLSAVTRGSATTVRP
jgi:hypothetical protein